MRIAVEYTPAVYQGGGIGRYTRELVHALAQLDAENEYILLVAGSRSTPAPRPRDPSTLNPRFQVRRIPIPQRWLTILWHRLRLPLPVEVFSGPIDLLHSPDYVLPPTRGARSVVTVHDLSFLTVPEAADPRLRRYLSRAVPRAVARADHVLADSHSTRDDLVTHLGVEPQRITVVYPGVDPRFRPLDEAAVQFVRARYDLQEPFILAVGTLEPRKNFPTLIEAYARLQDFGVALSEVQLVIAGGKGWLYEGIFAAVERLGLGERVRFLDFVPDPDLPALYNAAAVFAFPSLYEGFGLPPLEAMACGTPVITSNVSSLPEVVGDAALTVPPTDVAALAEALARALTDEHLRATLRQQGLQQAARFTWDAAARTLLAVYRGCERET
jgi:glycosyltransferase involved in cell wall biosynthesis